MSFIIDRQTLADLEILEVKGMKNPVFKFFDNAISVRGREELLNIFYSPLSDIKEIKERQDIIRYFSLKKSCLSIDKYLLDFIELYLQTSNKPVIISRIDAWHKAIKYAFKPTTEYYIIQRGTKQLIEFLQELYSLATKNPEQEHPLLLKKFFNYITESIQKSELHHILGFNTNKKISVMNKERFDYIFRFCENDRLKSILKIVYQIDAFQAVANSTNELGFIFPELLESKTINITGLYHPLVKNAVANDIKLNEEGNVLFLTGANMAGKSTFLKAFGLAVYFAHIGFPVAANSMQTGVFNGLLSTINIADNINKGYSHFYSEVLRIKKVAENINSKKNLVVIFDELFRSANIKDAIDASFEIVSAFSRVKGSIFLVSSHVLEAANQLSKIKNIRFGCFHTAIKEKTPVYSYHLQEGVTEERIGMLIIENEQIIEIINGTD